MRLKAFLVALLFSAVVLLPQAVFAVVSSCEQSVQSKMWSGDMRTLDFEWTADSTDGSFTAEESDWEILGWIVAVETNPGATAPTADYDITLTSEEGTDLLGGAGADRSTSANEITFPYVNSVYQPVPVYGTITLNITNNSENSATGLIRVYFKGTFRRP